MSETNVGVESPVDASKGRSEIVKLSLSFLFMAGAFVYAYGFQGETGHAFFLGIAAFFGAYMALNIGANDVANNVGPAVGSKALTMGGAIAIAAIFEAGGALVAGGDVVGTIKKGIIDPALFTETAQFVWVMTAALLAGGLWLNFATAVGAPVSTTHSIVGGVVGAGVAASGFGAVAWGTMGKIAASWVISPVLGGVIAALLLLSIKKSMLYKKDKLRAMKTMVPYYVAFMGWAFVTYLMLKGVKKLIQVDFAAAAGIGFIAAAAIFLLVKPMVAKAASNLRNRREDVNKLFTVPLIFAAALLSFAHGANDVANAVGPLAGIADAVRTSAISLKASIPLWVMMVGAVGIALGLALYGPRLIRTVGNEITELDQVRAYSIAMAAAITVIIASQLGLPVSSTHIAIGGVFGVGFLREMLHNTKDEALIRREKALLEAETQKLSELEAEKEALGALTQKSEAEYERLQALDGLIEEEKAQIVEETLQLEKAEKVRYVKRSHIKRIVAAWIITVPAAALLSAILYFVIRGIAA